MEDVKPLAESEQPTRAEPAQPAATNTGAADEAVAPYTALFSHLLSSLDALLPPMRPSDPPPPVHTTWATDWAGFRTAYNIGCITPHSVFGATNHDAKRMLVHFVRAAQHVGAAQLARDVANVERRAMTEGDEGRANGVWTGAAELLAWLYEARAALLRLRAEGGAPGPVLATISQAVPTEPIVPKREAQTPVIPSSVATSDSATVAPVASGSSFSFAPPPAAGVLAKKLEAKKKARRSAASSITVPVPAPAQAPVEHAVAPATPAAPVLAPATALAHSPPPAMPHFTQPPQAPESADRTSLSASSDPVASGAANAVAEPMAATPATALATPPAPQPAAPLPAGPPSAGFAPPAAPGQAFEKPAKARKPRASTSKSATPAPAASASQRPARRRKVPIKLGEGSEDEGDWESGSASGSRAKRRSSVAAAGDGAKGKKRRFSGFDDDDDAAEGLGGEEEVDELASDYEEQMERKAKKERERQLSREQSEELNRNRFAVNSCVMVKFPNYSWFPAIVLDPATAPAETQGKRVKGAYLVKSVPSGGDHRWVAPDDGSILAIQPTQLDDILLGRYKSPPPQSWIRWRGELIEAVMLFKDPARLADWLSRPTDLEVQLAAKAERKRSAKAVSYW